MELKTELNYGAGVDEVFSMLCDETFRKQVCDATHARSYDVSVTRSGAGVDVRVSRVMGAPEMAKRLIGETFEIVQTETWGAPSADGTRTADLTVEIPGKPASMKGKITLGPTASGAREAVDGEVTVKVPFVGAQFEKEIAQGLLAAIEEEGRVGKRWLAG